MLGGGLAMQHSESNGLLEIALVGDLTDNEGELTEKLLGVEPGGECTLYIDSPGGSPYCAVSLMTLILLRGLRVTGVVTGECSSAALWPYAACKRRLVTPYSVLLFHPMKWQSEEHVGLAEAAEWATALSAIWKTKWTNSWRNCSGWHRRRWPNGSRPVVTFPARNVRGRFGRADRSSDDQAL